MRERSVAVIQEAAAQGRTDDRRRAVDATLDDGEVGRRATTTRSTSALLFDSFDPAATRILDERGSFHLWNPGQAKPATPWEARIDDLMHQQSRTLDRRRAAPAVRRGAARSWPSTCR